MYAAVMLDAESTNRVLRSVLNLAAKYPVWLNLRGARCGWKPAALAVALSACAASSSFGVSASSPQATTATATTSGSTSAASDASGVIAAPDVMGKTADEARAIAKAAGITSEVALDAHLLCDEDPRKEGLIGCQDPSPGTRMSQSARLRIAVYKPWAHPGMLVRDQLVTLHGLTVEQAKERLLQLGHTGELIVHTRSDVDPRYGHHQICQIDSEAGISISEPLQIYINP